MRITAFAFASLFWLGGGHAGLRAESVFPSPSLQKVKNPPKKFVDAPDVVTEWTEAADVCEPEKVCVDGVVHNRGRRPAHNVRLLIEVGGGKYSKPRTSFYQKL